MDIDRCMVVLPQESGQSAAVVIVSVGQKRAIHTGNVQSQRVRVAQKQFALPEVEQQVLLPRLHIKAQAVFAAEGRCGCGLLG